MEPSGWANAPRDLAQVLMGSQINDLAKFGHLAKLAQCLVAATFVERFRLHEVPGPVGQSRRRADEKARFKCF